MDKDFLLQKVNAENIYMRNDDFLSKHYKLASSCFDNLN